MSCHPTHPAGGQLEPPDRHCPDPLVDPPVAAPHASPPGAALLACPQQAVERAAEMAPQRCLSQAHPAALEGGPHPWVLGGLHAQEHRAQAG